ncbi:hypothetical protein H4R34_003482 [Dimargaris verticillata]|uniref:Uncharacterized protein n=1 Tax=Dimargaris verticillata TaxID=2761393 RepID=A0A9W8EBZ5_9FUNG|nr:hypothetical protein H4R34_003482 [Dimargaris verticillata]
MKNVQFTILALAALAMVHAEKATEQVQTTTDAVAPAEQNLQDSTAEDNGSDLRSIEDAKWSHASDCDPYAYQCAFDKTEISVQQQGILMQCRNQCDRESWDSQCIKSCANRMKDMYIPPNGGGAGGQWQGQPGQQGQNFPGSNQGGVYGGAYPTPTNSPLGSRPTNGGYGGGYGSNDMYRRPGTAAGLSTIGLPMVAGVALVTLGAIASL